MPEPKTVIDRDLIERIRRAAAMKFSHHVDWQTRVLPDPDMNVPHSGVIIDAGDSYKLVVEVTIWKGDLR